MQFDTTFYLHPPNTEYAGNQFKDFKKHDKIEQIMVQK